MLTLGSKVKRIGGEIGGKIVVVSPTYYTIRWWDSSSSLSACRHNDVVQIVDPVH